jgi:hypothetical protein
MILSQFPHPSLIPSDISMLFSHFLLVSLLGCFLTNILCAFLQRHKFISTYLQYCTMKVNLWQYLLWFCIVYLYILMSVSFTCNFLELANFNHKPSNFYTFYFPFIHVINYTKKKMSSIQCRALKYWQSFPLQPIHLIQWSVRVDSIQLTHNKIKW